MKIGQKKPFVSAALVLCLLAGLAVCAKPQQAAAPYDFPLTSDDEEWKNLTTTDEMIAAYQIPEETLKKMSTEALVNTVLGDTFLTQFGAYSSSLDAMRMHRESFNIYPEMESRADYYEVLARLYEKAQVITEEDYNSRDIQPEEFYYLENLEYLIAADIYEHGQDAQMRAGREQWDKVIRTANARITSARAEQGELYSTWSNGFATFSMMLPADASMDADTQSLLAELSCLYFK